MNENIYLNFIQKGLFLLLIALLPLHGVDGVITTVLGTSALLAVFHFNRLKNIQPFLIICSLYGIWFLASSFWSLYPEIVYKGFKKEFLYSFLALIVGYCCAFQFKNCKFMYLSGFLSLALFLLASLSRAFPEQLIEINKFYPSVGDGSTSLVFFFAFATVSLLENKLKSAYFWGGIFILMISSYLAILYQNRMLFVSLAAMLSVTIMYKTKSFSRKSKLIASIAIIIAGTCLTIYSLSLKTDSSSGYYSNAKQVIKNDARIYMWDFYIKKGLEKPIIGYGAGYLSLQETFANNFPGTWNHAVRTHAHNVLINKWLQLGFIGLALFIMMYMSIFYYGYNGHFKDKEKELLKLFLLLIFVGFFSKSITDDFFIRNNLILFWLLCGFIIGRGVTTDLEHKPN